MGHYEVHWSDDGRLHCPSCGNRLYLRVRAKGYVCKNWKCKHYYKMRHGTIFTPSSILDPLKKLAKFENEYEIRKQLKPEKKLCCDVNCLVVEVGTNTPKGGDAGHGGRTLFELTDKSMTAWEVTVDGKRIRQPNTIKIELFGDSEALSFIEALEFAYHTLKNTQVPSEVH